MLELALHVLDIAENSSRAEASLIEVTIVEDLEKDVFSLEIRDNGHGMDEQTMEKALDPFYTTKKVRRIGLGLPMLKQAATYGRRRVLPHSRVGKGTVVYAGFKHSHIDRQPLGDIAGVITMLILGNPDIDIVYTHQEERQHLCPRHQGTPGRARRCPPEQHGGPEPDQGQHQGRARGTERLNGHRLDLSYDALQT